MKHKKQPEQKQLQQFEEKQAGDIQVQEQQYMVFQDLDNVAGIFAETLAVLEYFKEEPNHPYATIAQNRLVLQTNLSNGILCDLYQNNLDGKHQSQFAESKKQAKGYFEFIKSELLKDGKKGKNVILEKNEKVKQCADHYEKINLNSNNVIQQIQPLPNKVQSQFNQNSVQKLIDGMFEVDNNVQSIKDGNGYEIPTKEQILDKAKKRHDQALIKLQQNFPDFQKQKQGQKEQIEDDSLKEKQTQAIEEKQQEQPKQQIQKSQPQQQRQQQLQNSQTGQKRTGAQSTIVNKSQYGQTTYSQAKQTTKNMGQTKKKN